MRKLILLIALALGFGSTTAYAQFDAAADSVVFFNEYTFMPLDHVTPLTPETRVINNGSATMTGVSITANIYQSGTLVTTLNTATPVAQILPGDTAVVPAGSYTPVDTGFYVVEAIVSINETDANAANDTAYYGLSVVDSTYGRDDGTITGSLGIGAGTSGRLCNLYALSGNAEVTSVFFYLTNAGGAMQNQQVSASVYSFSNGQPGSLLGSTNTFTVPDTTPQTLTLGMNGGAVPVFSDSMLVCVEEGDSNVTLGTTQTIYTPDAHWIFFNGAWSSLEAFPPNLQRCFLIRPNVQPQTTQTADLAIDAFTEPSEYSWTPVSQVGTWNFEADAANLGSVALTNVELTVTIERNGTVVQNLASSPLATLAQGSPPTTLNAGTFTPTDTGTYEITYNFLADQTETNLSNNEATYTLYVSDSIYARDNGMDNGSLGIGPGTYGILGQIFTLNSPATVTTLKGYIRNGGGTMAGQPVVMALHEFNNGTPGALIDSTNVFTMPNNSQPLWITEPLTQGPALVSGDTFFVAIYERDSNVTIGTTERVFREDVTFIDFPGSPVGPWGSNEDYNFSGRTYMLRAHIAAPTVDCNNFNIVVMTDSVDASCGTCNDGEVSAMASGGTAPYSYTWSPGNMMGASQTGLTPGQYIVTVVDSNGCTATDTTEVSFTTGFGESENIFGTEIFPNPNDGQFEVNFTLEAAAPATLEVYDVKGARVYSEQLDAATQHQVNIDLGDAQPGVYMLQLRANDQAVTKRVIVR